MAKKKHLEHFIVPGEVPVRHYKTANVFLEEFNTYPPEIRSQYSYNAETHTYNLPVKTWEEWRRHGPYWSNPSSVHYIPFCIGGSEVAVLYGGSALEDCWYFYEGAHGNEYRSSVELFHDKLDLVCDVEPAQSKSSIFFTGHNLEEACARDFEFLFKKEHPGDEITIENDTTLFQCGRRDTTGALILPYCVCNLDRFVTINGEKYILECKTCSFSSTDFQLWKSGIVPLKYRLQLVWYMLCTNIPGAYIVVKTGLTPESTLYYFVERDFVLENLVIEMVSAFANAVKEKREPEIADCHIAVYMDYMRRCNALTAKNEKVQLPDTEKMRNAISKLEMLTDMISNLKKQLTQKEKELRELCFSEFEPIMGTAMKGSFKLSDSEYIVVTRSALLSKRQIDPIALKSKFPQIYEEFLDKLNETALEKEHPELYQDETLLLPPKASSSAGKITFKREKSKTKSA